MLYIYGRLEISAFRSVILESLVVYYNVRSPGFTRDWLINGVKSKKLEYKTSEKPERIDHTDKKILTAISQHARKRIVDIAQELSTTIDIVKYRLKRLKERRIISGFTVQLDLDKLGYEYYSIFFHMHHITELVEKQLIAFAEHHPNILFVVKVIGNYDIQLELEVSNYAELETNLRAFRQQFAEHIRDFEVLRVTKEYKYDFFPFDS